MKGILVNYEYCTGCHSCEIACKKHLGLSEGEWGIKLSEIGPFEYQDAPAGRGKDHWEWTWIPALTKKCTMCEDRTSAGKLPMCVQHCQAWCMYYGDLDELIGKIDPGTRYALLAK